MANKNDNRGENDKKDCQKTEQKKNSGLGKKILKAVIINAIIPGGDIFLGD